MAAQSTLKLEPIVASELETSLFTVEPTQPRVAMPSLEKPVVAMPDLVTSLPEAAVTADTTPGALSRSASSSSFNTAISTQSLSFSNHNSLRTAYNLGTLISTNSAIGSSNYRSLIGRVSSSDPVDYIRLNTQQHSNLDISLSNLQANADIRLIRDVNSNGQIDAGDVILGSFRNHGASENISVTGLGAGDYFIEVKNVNNSNTSYSLDIAATAGIPKEPSSFTGDTPSQAIPIAGQINGIRSFLGSVNSTTDTQDFYRFTINQAVQFSAILSDLSSDANLILYADTNKDMVMETSEIIGISAQRGNAIEAFSKDVLTAGDYYLKVVHPSNIAGSTNYKLDLNGRPFQTAKVTLDIHELKALAQFDSRVPWTNWHQADFFGTVKINGQSHRFGTIQDRDTVTGLKFTQNVSSAQRFIDFEIEVFDEDGLIDDTADIAPDFAATSIKFRYDTLAQVGMGTSGFSRTFGEGNRVFLQGTNGDLAMPNSIVDNTYAASINFSVNYDPIF